MLQLVADNTRPARSKPGYAECLARGECQKCHAVDGTVRTVGIRRAEQDWFSRAALCGPCLNIAQSEGVFPVVAAVRAPGVRCRVLRRS
jgi:hypothetical protein